MKLRFTRRAAQNLAAIGEYLNAVSPVAAVRIETSIQESLRNLTNFPLLGRKQKAEGVRKMVTPRYAYLIYYTFDADAEEIIILSVQHAKQKRQHDER